jgi:hypothetical protein
MSGPFSTSSRRIVRIARVRIERHVDRLNPNSNGWRVYYLPEGCAPWFWNWRQYCRAGNEESARAIADRLVADRHVTEWHHAIKEVVL